MKAALVRNYGSIAVEDVARPEPADGEVLVRVHATSVNAVDWYGFAGRPYLARLLMGLRKPKTSELGADFAGVVEAVGGGGDAFAPGDEVFGCDGGAFAELMVVDSAVDRKPTNLSFEEAAAVPLAALTALQGLRDHGCVQPGQRVLINGASGGVGTFAVQIAKALGAEVHAVCSTRNVEQATVLGADRVFDYADEDFTRSGVAYDVLFDNAGNRSWYAMRRALSPTGKVILVGGQRRKRMLGPLGHIVRIKLAAKLGRRSASFFIAKPNRADLAMLRDLVEAGHVRPAIERRCQLSQIAEAMREMGEGHARGKTVVTL